MRIDAATFEFYLVLFKVFILTLNLVKGPARHLLNFDGTLDGPDDKDYFSGSQTLEKLMETASLVTQCRDDHPEDVGPERDIIKTVAKNLEDANGGSEIQIGCGFVILFFKRQ
ncbi:hypothetical protein SLS57_003190 [Botryosphaeria dothidea]